MIVKFEDLPQVRATHQNRRIVFGGGSFDLLHTGHLEFLQNLRSHGNFVVVAVSSDTDVRRRKGRTRPVNHQSQRIRLIEAMKFVDIALIAPTGFQGEFSPSVRIIERLRPNVFLTQDKNWHSYQNKVTQFGTEFVYDDLPKSESTTAIIQRILERHGLA